MRSQPDNSVITDSLKDYLDTVELTVVEHNVLHLIVNNSHAKNSYRVQLSCQQLQHLTKNKHSLGAIEAALGTLYERDIRCEPWKGRSPDGE